MCLRGLGGVTPITPTGAMAREVSTPPGILRMTTERTPRINGLFLLRFTVCNRIPTWRQRLRAWANSGNVGVFLSAFESSAGLKFFGLQTTSLFLLLLLPGPFLSTFLGGRSR